MKAKKIIIRIIAAVLLLVSLTSMTSCFRLMDFYFDYVSGSPDEDSGKQSQTPDKDEDETQGGGEDDETGSGEVTNKVPEFYPSEGNLDGVSVSSLPILSTVTVTSRFKVISSSFFGSTTENAKAEGAGVIYKLNRETGDAYIITNFHVVYDADATSEGGISTDISVYLYGQESEDYAIPAKYIGGTLTNDLAVLKVSGSEILKNSSALPVTVGDSDKVAVMDPVVAIGNPEAACMSVTTGIISVDSETLYMLGADGKTSLGIRVMRVSAAINEGNSGGGLFNADGQLIGIVNAKKTGSDIDNIAYAIPSSVAVGIADNIIHYCDGETERSYKKCLLGITLTAKVMGVVVDPDTSKIMKAEVVEVAELTDTCVIADKIAVGDKINSITVDGVTKTATRIHHVTDHMITARVGSTVVLNVTRGTETFDITVTVPDTALTTVS